jgi:hypothetical protein
MMFRTPEGPGPFLGVLAVGGSDDGTPEYFVNLLVPEGFAVLAWPYWGTPQTQLSMLDIPLERVEAGLRTDVRPSSPRLSPSFLSQWNADGRNHRRLPS